MRLTDELRRVRLTQTVNYFPLPFSIHSFLNKTLRVSFAERRRSTRLSFPVWGLQLGQLPREVVMFVPPAVSRGRWDRPGGRRLCAGRLQGGTRTPYSGWDGLPLPSIGTGVRIS